MIDIAGTTLSADACGHAPRARGQPVLALEFVLLFFGFPTVFCCWLQPRGFHVIPVLVIASLACLLALLRSPGFDRRNLWNAAGARGQLRRTFTVFVSGSLAIIACIAALAPASLLDLPRERPLLWALIMILYPGISVYPQELIYRAFLFHRYDSIFPSPLAKILASALAFGFVHIVFRNFVALAMTAAGGILFAITYQRSRSLAAVWLEHALYGWLVFTVGLGRFFFHGTAETALRLLGSGAH